MRIRVQVVIEGDEDVPPEVHEVADLQRGDLGADTLGLQLAEAKELLARVQEVVVDEQVRSFLAAKVACSQMWTTSPPQGRMEDRGADPVRHPAPPQPPLAPLPLPAKRAAELQPAG